MDRSEAIRILKPLLDIVLSREKECHAAIPLLYELTAFAADYKTESPGPLKERIHRRYLRLCRAQEELGSLDLKKAAPGVSPEDYIFSRIDFSRYREIEERYFHTLFYRGLEDFSETFLRQNFNHGRQELQSLMEDSYIKKEDTCKIQKESALILSVMRTLETSLESLPLFTPEEIDTELNNFPGLTADRKIQGKILPKAEKLFPLLVSSLNGVSIPHEDGMTTKLFINKNGDLAGTFRPGNKPWTIVLAAG